MSPARPPTAPFDAAPFDAARALLADLPRPDLAQQDAARSALAARFNADLGLLGDLAVFLSGWSAGPIARPLIALYVATYADIPEAPSRARALIADLADGGGAVGALARGLGAGVEAFDLALDRPVRPPAEAPPMSAREAAATLAFGMEALAKEPDVLVLTDAAEGSPAVAQALLDDLAGGEGDALDRLALMAGREVSALAGAILAARVQKIPVVLESPAALAAAAVLSRGREGVLDHCLAAGPSPAQAALRLLAASASTAAEPGVSGAAALAMLKLASDLRAATRGGA